jgi:hypothetical protein
MAHNLTKDEVLEAIRGSNGIITNVQRKLEASRGQKISWDTTAKYVDKWEETKTALQSEKEAVLDMAEHNILKDIIDRHDVGTSKWYLRMKGKERGYEDTAKLQLDGTDPLNINLTGETMTAEELANSGDVEITGDGDTE